jgi:hypothetical protein
MSFGFGFGFPKSTTVAAGGVLGGGSSLRLNFLDSQTLDPRVTFSRTSNATQFDSTGALVYAPHNLLTFSESFDNAVWQRFGTTTVSSNTTVAPDGTTTADSVTIPVSSGIFQIVSGTAGFTYVFSVYIRAAAPTTVRLVVNTNLSDPVTQTINVTTQWQRFSLSKTMASGTTTVTSQLDTGGGATFFVWGAQLNVGALQPYYPTTVKNLLGFTQEFDNAGWTKTNSTITANATAAPDGSLTADKLVENTASSTHAIVQSFAVTSGTAYTLSVFAKNPERFLVVTLSPNATFNGTGAGVFFDLSNGTVRSSFGTVTPLVVAVGNGWYRCSISAVATATGTANATIALSLSGTSQTYTGDGTSGIFIWGAQLSDSASLDPYGYNPVAAPTSTAYYGPRFDYDPSTLAPRGLLIEEQRTNSIRNNSMVGASAPSTIPTNWQSNVGGMTLGVVGTGTENGITYIDIRFSGTPTQTFANVRFDGNTQIAAANGQTWTSSFYGRIVAGSTTNVGVVENRIQYRDAVGAVVLEDALNFTSTISAASLSVARRNFTYTSTSASTAFVNNAIGLLTTVGAAIDITLRIGLPQLELGAFATSVIPTTTAAATRTADVATMVGDNFSNWYRQDEGTLFADATPQASTSAGQAIIEAGDGTASNRIGLFKLITSGNASLAVLVSGATQASTNNGAWSVTGKIAGVYKLDDFASSYNGSAAATDVSGTVPVVNQLTLGRRQDGPNYLNGYIRQVTYFPRRLANSELQTVTL